MLIAFAIIGFGSALAGLIQAFDRPKEAKDEALENSDVQEEIKEEE